MYKVRGTNITLTRGDDLFVQLMLTKGGEAYTPAAGDVIRFAMKMSCYDDELLVRKVIPNDTLILHLEPEDTKDLRFGAYAYDLEITFADSGIVNTFIADAKLEIAPEVI